MKKNMFRCLLIFFMFLVALVAGPPLMRSTSFIQVASAHTREFEKNVTILANDFQVLDLVFQEGKELEFIFTIIVKEDIPIDVWFVNYENYVRLKDGLEFIFFSDGSGQQVIQASKIVSVTIPDIYKLVLANYNNQTVEVYITYDTSIYGIQDENLSEESMDQTSSPFWQSPIFLVPLGLIVGILVGVFVPRKFRKSKKEEPKATDKAPSPRFCGHCGKPVDTPYCPYCGQRVQTA